MIIEALEDRKILDRTLVPLSKNLGINPEWTKQYLTKPPINELEILNDMLKYWRDSKVRHNVNMWWKVHHHILPGKLTTAKVSQLPEAVYKQIIVLRWLTFAIEREIKSRRELPVITRPVVRPTRITLWTRILAWIKKHLQI